MSDQATTNNQTAAKTHSDDGLVARLASQRARFRDQATTAAKERDTLRTENTRLAAEVADLKTRSDSSAAVKRVAELEGKLRDVEHRKVFDKAAKLKGAAEAALDDLWTLSGYKAEGDLADEVALVEAASERGLQIVYRGGTDARTRSDGMFSIHCPTERLFRLALHHTGKAPLQCPRDLAMQLLAPAAPHIKSGALR